MNAHRGGQRIEVAPRVGRNHRLGIERNGGLLEARPTGDILQLCPDQRPDGGRIDTLQGTATAPPVFVEVAHDADDATTVRMLDRAIEQTFREQLPSLGLQRVGDLALDVLQIVLELEAEVGETARDAEPLTMLVSREHHLRRPVTGIAADQVEGNRRPLDARARGAEAVGKVPQVPSDGAPAPGHRGLRDACVLAVHRPLVEHQLERRDARQQVDERGASIAIGVGNRRRQLEVERAIDRRHCQRAVLDRLL